LQLTQAGYPTRTTHARLNGVLETIGSPWRYGMRKSKPILTNVHTGSRVELNPLGRDTQTFSPSGGLEIPDL